jgi:hypothetical protein
MTGCFTSYFGDHSYCDLAVGSSSLTPDLALSFARWVQRSTGVNTNHHTPCIQSHAMALLCHVCLVWVQVNNNQRRDRCSTRTALLTFMLHCQSQVHHTIHMSSPNTV